MMIGNYIMMRRVFNSIGSLRQIPMEPSLDRRAAETPESTPQTLKMSGSSCCKVSFAISNRNSSSKTGLSDRRIRRVLAVYTLLIPDALLEPPPVLELVLLTTGSDAW